MRKIANITCIIAAILAACVLVLYLLIKTMGADVLWGNQITDLSGDKRFWGGFRPGAVYQTQQPLLYDSGKLEGHFMWPSVSGGSGGSRVTFDQYKANPGKYPGISLVREGALIACTRIDYVRSLNYSRLRIHGEFASGELKGEYVSLHYMCLNPVTDKVKWRKYEVGIRFPDPALILEMTGEKKAEQQAGGSRDDHRD